MLGIALNPDGTPAAGAEVLLSTVSTPVSVYTSAPASAPFTRAAGDGSFRVTPNDQPLAVIVRSDAGVAQILVGDLKITPRLMLKPWARLEGTLHPGGHAVANARIHMMGQGPAHEWDKWHVMHDIETTTDAKGHYLFKKISPGQVMLEHVPDGEAHGSRSYATELAPGAAYTFDLGGNGGGLSGHVLGNMREYQVRNATLMPLSPQPPEALVHLSEPIRSLALRAWWESPEMKRQRLNSQPIRAVIGDDGTFSLDDVLEGKYVLQIRLCVVEPGSFYAEDAASAERTIVVPEIAAGAMPSSVNVGDIALTPRSRLKSGQAPPAIKGHTADGLEWKLTDLLGKMVVLHVHPQRGVGPGNESGVMAALCDRFCAGGQVVFVEVVQSAAIGNPTTAPKDTPSRLRISAANIPAEYTVSPSTLFIINADGKLLAKNLDAAQAFARLDATCGAPARARDTTITVDCLPPGPDQPAGGFTKIPKPGDAGFLLGKFEVIDGEPWNTSGPLTCLGDGRIPDSDDAPEQNVFFAPGTLEGRLRMDLGKVIPIGQINTYSRHKGTRSPQVYHVYGSDGAAAGFDGSPKAGVDPVTRGWKLVASVDTRAATLTPGGQCGVSIAGSTVPLGRFRYLLFVTFVTETDDNWGHTFYSEINVREAK